MWATDEKILLLVATETHKFVLMRKQEHHQEHTHGTLQKYVLGLMTDAAIPPHDAHMLASARVIYAMETIVSAECLDALIQVAVDELVRDLVPQHENAEAVLKTKWSEVQEKWKRCARHAAEDPVLLREIYQLVCAVVVHFLRENHTELCANE